MTSNKEGRADRYGGINKMLMLSFVELMSTEAFDELHKLMTASVRKSTLRSQQTSPYPTLVIAQFYEWLYNLDHDSAERIRCRLEANIKTKNGKPVPGERSTGDVKKDKMMHKLQSEQTRQVLMAALSVRTYSVKKPIIGHLFFNTFMHHNCPIGLINGSSVLQKKITKYRRMNADLNFGDNQHLSFLEATIYFHAMMFVYRAASDNRISLQINYKSGNKIGYTVQRVCRAFVRLREQSNQDQSLTTLISPYMWYNRDTGMFQVLSKREDGFAHASQQDTLQRTTKPTTREGDVTPEVWKRPQSLDKALRYLTYLFFDTLHNILSNNDLYRREQKDLIQWSPFKAMNISKTTSLPLIFATLPESVVMELKVARPVPPPNEVINVDEQISPPTARPEDDRQMTNSTVLYSGGQDALEQVTQAGQKRAATMNSGKSSLKRVRTTETGTWSPHHNQNGLIAKEEDIIAPEPSLCDNLDEAGQKAFSLLRTAMRPYCAVYACSFNELEQNHEEQAEGETILEGVDLILTDPPYNTRRELNQERSDYDCLTQSDMDDVVDVIHRLLVPGGHFHIFCSGMQFQSWVRRFDRITEDVYEHDKGEENGLNNPVDKLKDGDNAIQSSNAVRTKFFTVEKTPLLYIREVRNYNCDPRRRRLTHMSIAEQAVHGWRNGPSHQDLLRRVDYNMPGNVPSSHPSWTNVIDNIPRLPPTEVVYCEQRTENGRRRMLRPEQKCSAMMMDTIVKYTKPGGVVVDLFGGTWSVLKACMMLPQHRRGIACDIDDETLEAGMMQLVEVFAKQVQHELSDIEGNEEVQTAARTFLNSMGRLEMRLRDNLWKAPPGLPSIQSFPPHIINFLACYHQNQAVRQLKNVSLKSWSPEWRARFNQTDVRALLSCECMELNLTVKPSTIRGAGMGLFTTIAIGRGTVISHYYGVLVYRDIGRNVHSPHSYGEGHMTVTPREFLASAVNISWCATDTHRGVQHRVWIHPAPFCSMRYINDARYLPNENGPSIQEIAANPTAYRHNNCIMEDVKKQPTISEFGNYRLLKVVALKNIPAHTELFFDYGVNYIFPDRDAVPYAEHANDSE